ncbi:MAG: fatty acid cis/trans isomerase [Marinobacter sp.]|uniref:fatty acid cis/trans isomerase n=1 Tax=Marinobacter sp. TaxID=50741 RepID=UPI001B4B797C|nr:fatty acid cis/trans isomerase [Marinobacter sp.]MBQ0745311.1 fatty acid cis/trans isomerase [Marinobacter sp.]MBQ0813033.1 fatty acid cis/trans isomerase [Marinobacter sp.]
MARLVTAALLALLFQPACAENTTPSTFKQARPTATQQPVSFNEDVRPIVEAKCLACHSCFDAPCQLKMEYSDGLIRGAHKDPVYNGARFETQKTTRLGIDAQNEQQWREMGFYSVLARGDQTRSLFENMIRLGKEYEFAPNSKLPEDIELGLSRANQCVSNADFPDYASDHPYEGMPLAMTGLTDDEYATLTGWLNQGGAISPLVTKVNDAEQNHIQRWETWLNEGSQRRQLVSRWTYEHLYLAHLYFEESGANTRFFEIVRSRTPAGTDIEIIATRRPNDDPKSTVYYRLRPVAGSIVHKRHITFDFGEQQFERTRELFETGDWQVETVPDYSRDNRANPFATFAAIPAKARYQFMLDNAEYFTRSFIRGPVCRGQIATDVIRDQFWVAFHDPEKDLFVTNAEYRDKVTPLLALPGQDSALLDLGDNWSEYKGKRNHYRELRNSAYQETYPKGASLDHIWDGDGNNTNALLTVFRHHDNASVQRGLIGRVPLTSWWMDYPLLERTYYELVVNFDVFGNVAHQAQTRLYFDLIRNGSEQDYLRLIPPGERSKVLQRWYQGAGKLKLDYSYASIDDTSPSQVPYATSAFNEELGARLLLNFRELNAERDDPINRCGGSNCGRKDEPEWVRDADRVLSELAATRAEFLPAINYLPDVTFLRVYNEEGKRTVYTVIRNRAHSNVAFLLGEDLRYQPENDELTIYPGIIGSYPNFMFDIPASQLGLFKDRMKALKAEEPKGFEALVGVWGVRRTHRHFWEILHDITAWQQEHQPLQAGIFDINRYKNL